MGADASLDPARLCEIFPPEFEAAMLDVPSVDARNFRPLPKQAEFLESTAPRKAMITGLGYGKTATGAFDCFVHGLLANPEPHLGIVTAPTFPMLRDATIPKLREVFPADALAGGSWDAAFNSSQAILRTALGSMILCRSVDGTNYERLRNIEAAWGWMDEASLMKSAEPWNVLCGRLRQRARKRCAWLTTTPRGQNWVAERFVLKPLDGHMHVHATTYDNPYLPKDYIAGLEASYSEEWIRQEMRAEILSMQGAVYPKLSDDLWPHGNALVYEPDRKTLCHLEVDFGFRNPAVHLVQEVETVHPETGERCRLDVIVWELQGPKGGRAQNLQVHQWLSSVEETGFKVSAAYGDPAGDAVNDQTYRSSAMLLVDRLQVPFHKPTRDWQRSKVRGEETVRRLICAADGSRKLVWAAKPSLNRMGKHELWAPNTFACHRNLQYQERKPGMPQPEESYKDGVNDHDTDATRYRSVFLYGRENVIKLWGQRNQEGYG